MWPVPSRTRRPIPLRLTRRQRVELRAEHYRDVIKRPVCWWKGHVPVRKMDLHRGSPCGRCAKYVRDKR